MVRSAPDSRQSVRRPEIVRLTIPARLPAFAVVVLMSVVGPGRALLAQVPPTDRPTGGIPLTLHEAVAAALDYYPSVRVAEAVGNVAQATLGQARSAWWPEIGLAGSLTQFQEPMIATPIHAFTPGETPAFDETLTQAGGYLSYTLFDGGGRRAGVRTAEAEVSAAAADLGSATQTLVANVTVTYVEILARTQVLAAHDRRIQAFAEELDRVRQLRAVGRAAELEVLRVEAAFASAQSDRVSVESGLGLARRELARLRGASATETERPLIALGLIDDATPVRDALIEQAAVSSTQLGAARGRLNAAQARVSLARSARWPRLEFDGSWVDRGGIDADHSLEWAAGVRVAVPLFTGGRIADGIARAQAQARGADERLRLVLTETEGAVDRLISSIEETGERERSLEIAVARSQEVVRIELLRLETGTGTQTDYLDAEAGLLTVQAALAEASYARIRARVELARVLGALTPSWLEQNLGAER